MRRRGAWTQRDVRGANIGACEWYGLKSTRLMDNSISTMASVVVVAPGDRLPRLPGDSQDHERDAEADERIADVEAERHDHCARDDRQADEGVDPRVVAVGDQRGAV